MRDPPAFYNIQKLNLCSKTDTSKTACINSCIATIFAISVTVLLNYMRFSNILLQLTSIFLKTSQSLLNITGGSYIGAISKSLYTHGFQRPVAIKFIMAIFLIIKHDQVCIKHVLGDILTEINISCTTTLTVKVIINQLSIFTIFKCWQMRMKNQS